MEDITLGDSITSQGSLWRAPKIEMYRGWYREEILETINERAVITRSQYGYRVLNTPDLCFVDIDHDPNFEAFEQLEVLSQLHDWVKQHPQQSWHVYKTAAGLRLMRTDAPQSPAADFDALCELVHADTLYRQLCHEQKTYRARLTAKPRRVGVIMPSWNYYWFETQGWMSDYDAERLPTIIEAYELLAQHYKTCRLLETIGSGKIHPGLKRLVELHDELCRVRENVPLEQRTLEESCWGTPRMADIVNFHLALRYDSSTQKSSKHTPDTIWALLTDDVRSALKTLDGGGDAAIKAVQDEDQRLKNLQKKWAAEYRPVSTSNQAEVDEWRKHASRQAKKDATENFQAEEAK